MDFICGDNRFEIIEQYKKKLIDGTNIEDSPDEMAVLDNILFRFWQMGWLKEQEKAKVVFGRCKDGSFATECGHCGMYLDKAYSTCPKCNKELDWNSNQS